MAKLEPFVVQPVTDSNDVDLFLEEVEEEHRQPQEIAPGSEAEIHPDDRNLSHFMEFLERRKKRSQAASRSKVSVALERYEAQKAACPTAAETEIADLAKFRKFA